MVAPLKSEPLGALGAFGQNTQSTAIDLPPTFAVLALNCYANQGGRLTSRYAFERNTTNNADLGTTNATKRVYRHNKADGTSVLVCSGNNRIFTSDGTTLTSRESGYSADRWQFASLNGKLFAAQASHSLRWFNETTWAVTNIATPSNPIAIGALFGRLWALSSDGWTLHWSDLLDGTNFTTGASGSMDLNKLHTTLRSPGVAITSIGRSIVVLCRDTVLVLGLSNDMNPNDTTTPIYLMEYISGVGCIARDTAVATGDDTLFLADDGLRSLTRSLQEKQGPAPLTDVSALNTNALKLNLAAETTKADITACWHPGEAWYQLFWPTTKEIWNFDIGQKVPEADVPRLTTWTLGATRVAYHGVYWTDDDMRYCMIGGLGTNNDFDDTDEYTFGVETGWLSLQSPDSLKTFKRLLLNLRGGAGQSATVRWYVDFDESQWSYKNFTLATSQAPAYFNVDEFNIDEFSAGTSSADNYLNLSKSAKFIKFVIEIPVSASEVTLNNAQVFFKQGRVR